MAQNRRYKQHKICFLNPVFKHMHGKDKQILAAYLPEKAVDIVSDWIKNKKIHLKIARNRKTKFGDYRPPIHHTNHRISVNYNLNPYAFLITFVHEYAHLLVFEQHKKRVLPHGREWKNTYKTLMREVLDVGIFPEDLAQVLEKSIRNSKASNVSDLDLSRVLHQYDAGETQQLRVEDLPDDTVFETQTGKQFQKGEKQRIRYKCRSLDNGQLYLLHPLTPVTLVEI